MPCLHKCRKTTVNFDKSVLEIGHPRAVEVELKKVSVTTKKKPKTAAKKRIDHRRWRQGKRQEIERG
jgi:hypothetical protein